MLFVGVVCHTFSICIMVAWISIKDRVQCVCNILFLISVIAGLITVIILHLNIDPHLDNTRCKCVCPHNVHTTDKLNTTVFLEKVSDAKECVCELVVPDPTELLCLQCECTFETRNKLLIQVIIISVILVIIALLIYTVGYFIAQCFAKRRLQNTGGYTALNERSASINNSNWMQFHSEFHNRISRERRRGYT